MYNQPKRIEFLDSVRGLAALAVLLFHSMIFEWPKGFMNFINLPVVNILFDGHAAVVMFFVLSGFVLSRPYLNSQPPRSVFLPTFYLRRIIRIWLPWFFAFCLSALVVKLIFRDYETIPPHASPDFWNHPLTLSSVLRQMALMNLPIAKDAPYLMPQDWSLGIELKASLLIPFFIFCARGKKTVSLIVIAILLMFVSVHGYYVSFILGVALARFCDQIITMAKALPKYALGLMLALGIAFYQSLHIAWDLFKVSIPVRGYFWCLSSIGCVLILAVILSSIRLQKLLQHSFLVFLGRISYSFYLLHWLTLWCLQPLIVHWLNSLGIFQPVILLPVALGGTILFTFLLATLSHRFIEVPTIELGHHLTIMIQRFCKKND
jgi:peptidoglycan/LPS O-acetylase OafA/YrhL